LQANLKNEERFYLEMVIPFGNRVTNMSDLRRRQEDPPSPNRIKQLKTCWKEKVKNLHLIVDSCEQAISEKAELFINLTEIDLARSTNEVQDPNLILKSLSLSLSLFKTQIRLLRPLWLT
jgi:hypothetical protein